MGLQESSYIDAVRMSFHVLIIIKFVIQSLICCLVIQDRNNIRHKYDICDVEFKYKSDVKAHIKMVRQKTRISLIIH